MGVNCKMIKSASLDVNSLFQEKSPVWKSLTFSRASFIVYLLFFFLRNYTHMRKRRADLNPNYVYQIGI